MNPLVVCLVWIIAPLLPQASSPASSPAAPPDVAAESSRARELFNLLAEHKFAEFVAAGDERVRENLKPADLEVNWSMVEFQVGRHKREGFVGITSDGDKRVARILDRFERGIAGIRLVFNEKRQVSGVFIDRVERDVDYHAAPYVQRDAFDEEIVPIVADRTYPLAGFLSLPRNAARCAAIVLVHDSGPQDADSTVGPNRPFRDLAHGLACRGIAALRYEKRSHVFGHAKDANDVTLDEETIDDALAAVSLLRGRADIDPSRIFVIGHGLGGFAAPLIAQRDAKIAGLVLLAPFGRSILDNLYDQSEHLTRTDGEVSAAERAELARLKTFLDQIREGKAEHAEPTMGLPARYLARIHRVDPFPIAEQLDLPMMIVRGSRDYQSTSADLAAWRERMGSKPRVVIREYPRLNHMFLRGGGFPTREEYQFTGNVDEAVVADIAEWIGKATAR